MRSRLVPVVVGALCAVVVADPAWSAPPPLEAYGRLPAVGMVELSPSGDQVAYLAGQGEGRALIAQTTTGTPLLKVPVGTMKVRDVLWAGEEFVLVVVSKAYNLGDGERFMQELGQVLVINLKARQSYWVFSRGAVMNSVFGVYGIARHEGRWYGHFGGVRRNSVSGEVDDGYPDLYRVDLETGDARLLDAATVRSREWLVADDGRLEAVSEYNHARGEWRLWAGEGERMLAEFPDPYGAGALEGLGRAPGTVLYRGPDVDGETVFLEAAASAPAAATALPADGPVRDLLRDRASGLIIGVVSGGDRPETTLYAPKQQARFNAIRKALPTEGEARLVSWNAAFDKLMVFTEGSGDSGAYWLIDARSGRADEFALSYPEVGPEAVGTVRMFDYKAADGLQLHGVLTLPPGRAAENLPLVVLPHGGPAARDRVQFDWWAQAYAARGYAVFQPNFRGSSGYGRAFLEAGFGEWGRKMQTDVSDGVRALGDAGIVDPGRACIVGASYGGYAALAGVTLQNGLYRCAVSVAGVSDPQAMLRHTEDRSGRLSEDLRWWKAFMGAEGVTDAGLREIAPVDLAARADAPVLLIHGKEDLVVPVEQSRLMSGALKRAGKPVEFVELAGEDHDLLQPETRVAMLKASVAFVEKHNPADPAPPAKAAP